MFSQHVCICTMCIPSALVGKKRASDALELVRGDCTGIVGTGKQTLILCGSSQCLHGAIAPVS